ncbi:MAG TPA: sigma factor-like helix-turn-helix DNA-binding protein [Ktedonobacterales bacterium]|jgi:DNA-directed RNA polymerase sigma subunit (sigma70/sigma32)
MSHPAVQLRNINRFIYAIYDSPRQLSDILREAGVNDRDVNQIRHHQLEPYMVNLAAKWEALFKEVLPSRQTDIVVRYYGLTSEETTTLQQLGNEYNVSRERIRQLREHAVERLKQPDYKKKLEQLTYEVAQEILKTATP